MDGRLSNSRDLIGLDCLEYTPVASGSQVETVLLSRLDPLRDLDQHAGGELGAVDDPCEHPLLIDDRESLNVHGVHPLQGGPGVG